MKIAICISNYNRPELLYKSLEQHIQCLPLGPDVEARFFIVDDASKDKTDSRMLMDIVVIPGSPFQTIWHQFINNKGIAAVKNKCLELSEDWGAEHIFLFDSDCYPIADMWWKPYIDSGENHLMYQFKLPYKSDTDMQELYRDHKITAWSHTRGAMIYVTKKVLQTVGGFDETYGQAYFEHPDYTNRIHNAGLTTHRAMDVVNSHQLLYCLDQDGKIESSIPDALRRKNIARNAARYQKSKTSKEYKAYK